MTRGIKIWTNIDIEAATREKGIRFNFRNKKERKQNKTMRREKQTTIVSSTCCNVHVITKSKGSGLAHNELDDVG